MAKENQSKLKVVQGGAKEDPNLSRDAKIERALNAQGKKSVIAPEVHAALGDWWESKGKAAMPPEMKARYDSAIAARDNRKQMKIVKEEEGEVLEAGEDKKSKKTSKLEKKYDYNTMLSNAPDKDTPMTAQDKNMIHAAKKGDINYLHANKKHITDHVQNAYKQLHNADIHEHIKEYGDLPHEEARSEWKAKTYKTSKEEGGKKKIDIETEGTKSLRRLSEALKQPGGPTLKEHRPSPYQPYLDGDNNPDANKPKQDKKAQIIQMSNFKKAVLAKCENPELQEFVKNMSESEFNKLVRSVVESKK